MFDPQRFRQLTGQLILVIGAIFPEHGPGEALRLDIVRLNGYRARVLIGEGEQRLALRGLHRQPRNLRLIVPVLGKTLLRIVEQFAHDIIVFHVGVFAQVIAQRGKQRDLLWPKIGLGDRIVLRIRFRPVNPRLDRPFRYPAIKTNPEVHLAGFKPGGQVIVDHKIGAVFIRCGDRRPVAGVIQIRVEVLRAVGHVVGHQVDVVQHRGHRFDVHPAFRALGIGAHGDSHQLLLTDCLTQRFQQGSEVVAVSRLAGHQSPGAVDRKLPVEVNAVQTILLDDFLRGTNKDGATFCGRRRAGETTRAPAADRQQDFEVRILFTQGGELLQIRLHLRRQPDLVQMSRILQGRIGLVFFIVIDKAKRVVEMGDLPDVQLIDITARPGGDVAAAVKIADGHQRLGRERGSAKQGQGCQQGQTFHSGSSLT